MEKDVGNWDQRKDVENDEKYMTECARSAVMIGRGNIQTLC